MQAAVAWRFELLVESVRFVRKFGRCDSSAHMHVRHRQILACLLLELAACARARARSRLEASEVGQHMRMDAFVHELTRDQGKKALYPFRHRFVENAPKDRDLEVRVDGNAVKNDVGLLCEKRGVEDDKKFEASAIGSWLELWQLILVLTLEESRSSSTEKIEYRRCFYFLLL